MAYSSKCSLHKPEETPVPGERKTEMSVSASRRDIDFWHDTNRDDDAQKLSWNIHRDTTGGSLAGNVCVIELTINEVPNCRCPSSSRREFSSREGPLKLQRGGTSRNGKAFLGGWTFAERHGRPRVCIKPRRPEASYKFLALEARDKKKPRMELIKTGRVRGGRPPGGGGSQLQTAVYFWSFG